MGKKHAGMLFVLIGLFLLIGLFPQNRDRFESVYSRLISIIKKEPPDTETKIILTGDVMLGRTVWGRSKELGDYSYPFLKVADRLKTADIVFANLENPIIENCPPHSVGFKFCAPPEMLNGLKFAGINIVNLANNHTYNYGKSGFEETKKHLKDFGIKYVGEGNLEIIENRGIKYGFLGFDFLTYKPTDQDYQFIRESKDEVDVLIVGVHWGVEYQAVANKYQRETARRMIEFGANIISGHHPHWAQDMECLEIESGELKVENLNAKCDGSLVLYSLGNFVFDQMWSEETRKGLAVELDFDGSKIKNSEYLPIYMQNWSQPEWVE